MADGDCHVHDEKLDLLLEITRSLHAEMCGTPEPRPRAHLRIAGTEAPQPQARLADVIDFPRRAGQERSGT